MINLYLVTRFEINKSTESRNVFSPYRCSNTWLSSFTFFYSRQISYEKGIENQVKKTQGDGGKANKRKNFPALQIGAVGEHMVG